MFQTIPTPLKDCKKYTHVNTCTFPGDDIGYDRYIVDSLHNKYVFDLGSGYTYT